MAGGSGSFFKNCKSEKVGEYVRGRQEGSRRREGEKNRDRRHGIKDVLFLKSFFFNIYSNVGRLFCTPAPPKFTKKLAVDSFFNFGS